MNLGVFVKDTLGKVSPQKPEGALSEVVSRTDTI
jgi:hypothetical protein